MRRRLRIREEIQVRTRSNVSRNLTIARRLWGRIPRVSAICLEELTTRYRLSIGLGDVQRLEGHWYVTHTGLLHLASRHRCRGIRVDPVREWCDPIASRWVFKATVYKLVRSKGFCGYGDADPSNVSPLMRGAEMRIAETRAVNRALRKAYGIGLCSIEELGWSAKMNDTFAPGRLRPPTTNGNGHDVRNQPRLRDQLCLL